MMTVEELLKEISALDSAERERFYMKVMEGYFRAMMSNPGFMEEAFNCMASYLNTMKEQGLDVSSILSEMEEGIGMRRKVAAA